MRIGKNKVGIEFIPQDPEGLRLFGEIQKAVAGGCESGQGLYPGAYLGGAAFRIAVGLGGPDLNGTGQALEAVSVYEKVKGLIDAHPEGERIRRALWLDVVRFVLLDCLWWKNEFDPTEVVRFSRVAAAKMLSQKRLVGVGGEGKELRLKRAEVRGYCVSEGNRPDVVFKIE